MAKKLNSQQAKFLANIKNGMKRVDAYIDAYDYDQEDRVLASQGAYQLISNNIEIKAEIDAMNDERVEYANNRMFEELDETLDMYFRIRDHGLTEHNVRFRVCKDHLDRVLGQAKQEVGHSGEVGINITQAIMDGDYYKRS